jgi:ubiquinone/menaquinone biosynthesis C-methylase UbiE
MTIRDAYSSWSSSYDTDRNLTRDLDQVITKRLLADQCATTLLELGCGTGKNTPFYASIAQQVIAFDFSDGMIAQAKAKISSENVQFTQTDLTQPWPCPNNRVDLAVCNLVLEHIEDLGFIFSEVARVLNPGGQFFISELHPFKYALGKQATFKQGDQQVNIPGFLHHISHFTDAASSAGFSLTKMGEWWHEEDPGKPPRLVTFLFQNGVSR